MSATPRRGRACAGLLMLAAACKVPPPLPPPDPAPRVETAAYAYAVYDNNDALLHSPIPRFEQEVAERARRGDAPISDVYVLVHGWDFTVEEAFALFEGHRAALDRRVAGMRRCDPAFEPFFVFVTWSSVTRPISSALRSVLPFQTPDLVEGGARVADVLAFHLPSAWGESQDAIRLALGPPRFWSALDPARSAHDEYVAAVAAGSAHVELDGFLGYEVPVSLLLRELAHLRDTAFPPEARPSLHVVGHSFGAKLASLAAYDAVQRETLCDLARGGPLRDDDLIDSLVLLLPAMQASEMYWEIPAPFDVAGCAAPPEAFRALPRGGHALRFATAARRIGTKVLVHSRYDSANGWVFALGDLLIDHDAAARAQRMLARSHERPLPPPRTFGQRAVTFPFDVADRTLQVAVRSGAIVGQTLVSDLGAVIDGFVEAGYGIVADARAIGAAWDEPGKLAGEVGTLLADVAKLPLAPLLVQRALGNGGLDRPRSTVGGLRSRWIGDVWLDDAARDFLEASQRVDADDLVAASVTLATPPDVEGEAYLACDARKLFDGRLGGTLDLLIPPGAHGDLRSNDELVGPGPIRLGKRVRTMNLLYNLTRGPKLARDGTCGAPAASPASAASSAADSP